MDKKYIINLQGKDFVLHEGLLNEFHTNGGKGISTELVSSPSEPEEMFIFRATATGEKGTFIAYGDASRMNVNSMIARHVLRMAETRAINRALRLYNNIGMCSAEELGGDEVDASRQVKNSRSTSTTRKENPINLEAGDKLMTGNKNGKDWYGIKKQSGTMTWLTADQYEYLSNFKKDDDAPPPSLEGLPF